MAEAIKWQQVGAGFILGLIVMGIYMVGVYGPDVATEWYEKGIEKGKELVVVVPPQPLTIGVSPENFDFSAAVASDGSVASDTSDTVTLSITHEGNKNISDLRLTFKDPVTGKEGIPADLEIANFELYVVIAGSSIPLYKGATYLSYVKPLTVPGEQIDWTIQARVLKSPAGTFKDGQTYSLTLYIYQPEANFSDSIEVAVLT